MWQGLDYEQRDALAEATGFSLSALVGNPVLVSSAIFCWVTLLCAAICLARRHPVRVIPLLPGLFIWATILVATPLAFSLRYVFPLVLVMPLAVVTSLVPGEESVTGRSSLHAGAPGMKTSSRFESFGASGSLGEDYEDDGYGERYDEGYAGTLGGIGEYAGDAYLGDDEYYDDALPSGEELDRNLPEL